MDLAAGIALDFRGDYIVAESGADVLSRITPNGTRTVLYRFRGGWGDTWPLGVAIDRAGNYIVTEYNAQMLSRVTPDGERTMIYRFAASTYPAGVAIDSEGNCIVAELLINVLSRITPSGTRTVIHAYAASTSPSDIKVVPSAPSFRVKGSAATFWFGIVSVSLLLTAAIGSMFHNERSRKKRTQKSRKMPNSSRHMFGVFSYET